MVGDTNMKNENTSVYCPPDNTKEMNDAGTIDNGVKTNPANADNYAPFKKFFNEQPSMYDSSRDITDADRKMQQDKVTDLIAKTRKDIGHVLQD